MENMSLEQINHAYFDLLDKSKGSNKTAFFMYLTTRRMISAAIKQENIYNMHQELKARLKEERKKQKAQQKMQAETSFGR